VAKYVVGSDTARKALTQHFPHDKGPRTVSPAIMACG